MIWHSVQIQRAWTRAEWFFRTWPPRLGNRIRARDGTACRPSSTGLQATASMMAGGARQQQTTMEETLATSRLATRPSTRAADQTTPGGGPHPVVRWVTRLTEFLRTSTSGGPGGFETVAPAGFLQASPTDLAMTPARLGTRSEDSAMMLGRQTQAMITFSPPEELPQRSGLSVPTSWTQERGSQGEPLFTRDQIRRADELQAQAPLLFPSTATPVVVPPSSDGTSTHSLLVRAEIQRQLETYGSRQRVEIQRLQQEIFSLRAEREALRQHGDARVALLDGRSGSNAQGVTSLASSIGQSVVKAVRPLLPVGLLHSTGPEDSGNLVDRHLSSAAPASVAPPLLPGRDGVPQASPLLPGSAGIFQQLPGHGGVPQTSPTSAAARCDGCLSAATGTWWSTTSTSATTSSQGHLSSATGTCGSTTSTSARTGCDGCLSATTRTGWSTTGTSATSTDISQQLPGQGGVPPAPPSLSAPGVNNLPPQPKVPLFSMGPELDPTW